MKKPKNKIFLIEDELDIMAIYKTALNEAGIEVEDISTGKEAMEKIKEVQEGKREKFRVEIIDEVYVGRSRFDGDREYYNVNISLRSPVKHL